MSVSVKSSEFNEYKRDGPRATNLGEGTYGYVWPAIHQPTKRAVAIKTIKSLPGDVKEGITAPTLREVHNSHLSPIKKNKEMKKQNVNRLVYSKIFAIHASSN